MCWGSCAHSYPLGSDHCRRACVFASNTLAFVGQGRIETSDLEDQRAVPTIIDRHFNAYPLMPVICNLSSQVVGFIRHLLGGCAIFAKTEAPIDCGLTYGRTGILSHDGLSGYDRRVIKHDLLHHFGRPRIDLVVFVLGKFDISRMIRKVKLILERDPRLGCPSWRKTSSRPRKNSRESLSLTKRWLDII